MSRTAIAWTDETWNPVTGCTKVSPGCKHCYAETFAGRQMGAWRGRKFTDVQCHMDRLDQPLCWRKPRKVFVNSMSDLFHPAVSDGFLLAVFAVMANTRHSTFQVLTKRPERMRAFVSSLRWRLGLAFVKWGRRPSVFAQMPFIPGVLDPWERIEHTPGRHSPEETVGYVPPNIWLGVSVEDQATANTRIDILLQTPAARRFVSCEPLLGPVDLTSGIGATCEDDPGYSALEVRPDDEGDLVETLDWVIVGGESGPKARPCDAAWIRAIVQQCRAAAVPCFVKQLGSFIADRNDRLSTEGPGWDPDDASDWPEPACGWDDGPRGNVVRDLDGSRDGYQGAPVRIRTGDRAGADMTEWPADLRVRQSPTNNGRPAGEDTTR